jgi:hypothetical protein
LRGFAFSLILALLCCARAGADGGRPAILVVGYLPPTNEMLREFSTNPAQNPGGWVGSDWEHRGFDIYAYFPEFPAGAQCMGVGDFEIDYQDTTTDFARITQQLHPVAVLTMSLGSSFIGWGLEPAYQRWRMPTEVLGSGSHRIPAYLPDCTGQRYPYGSPVLADAPGHVRFSNLPMHDIAEAVRAAMPGTAIAPFVYPYDPRNTAPGAFCGNYLSGYIAYLAAMYRDRHQPPDANPCLLTGHIHVGRYVTADTGTIATEISLRQIISTMQTMNNTVHIAGGACCNVDGDSCMYSIETSCTGLFLGLGTACVPGACPSVPMGSCCLIDGTCRVTSHEECDDGPRVWHLGGACEPDACPMGVLGVCCRGATCNTVIGPAECSAHNAAAGALYSLRGDRCEPAPGMARPCCHADYDKNGTVSVVDILGYLQDWLDVSPFARIGTDGSSGAPVADDLFAFLGSWFAGCD